MKVPPKLNISDEQSTVLKEFRSQVADILKPQHDDYFLMRWLKARNWNVNAAEKMIRESFKWRETWKVDEIESWEPNEVLINYYPYGFTGFDKEGSPVIVVPFYGLDIVGMVYSVSKSDFIRMTIKTLEKMLKMAEEQSLKYGFEARKLVLILDMEGFILSHYAWRPAGELLLTLIRMYEANYPEILKAAFIINTTRIFYAGFGIVKKFLHDYTINKIHIFKAEPNKWMPALLKTIDPDQLPAHYGGTLVDENGDPKCSSMICHGGKIPRSYYLNKIPKDVLEIPEKITYNITEIKKGKKIFLDFEAPSPGCTLRWQFRTEHYDIKFGILRLEADGTEVEEIPMRRVKCNKVDEMGLAMSDSEVKYRVIFDNSYSYLRSKKVHHLIQVLPPLVDSSEIDSTN